MLLIKKILILEDNFKVLSAILKELNQLEEDQPYTFEIMVLTSGRQVERYINSNPEDFDIVILDRDCKLNESFHVLNIKRIGADKIIGISSIEGYNIDLTKKGINLTITKDLSEIDKSARKIVEMIKNIITPDHINKFRRKL